MKLVSLELERQKENLFKVISNFKFMNGKNFPIYVEVKNENCNFYVSSKNLEMQFVEKMLNHEKFELFTLDEEGNIRLKKKKENLADEFFATVQFLLEVENER